MEVLIKYCMNSFPKVDQFIRIQIFFLLPACAFPIDTSRICLSAHKTIEAGNENRLFTMDYIARLDFKLLFCVHSSKFGKCLLVNRFWNEI